MARWQYIYVNDAINFDKCPEAFKTLSEVKNKAFNSMSLTGPGFMQCQTLSPRELIERAGKNGWEIATFDSKGFPVILKKDEEVL